MKSILLSVLSLLAMASMSAPIHQGLRGSDNQRIRLTPKQRKLDRGELKELARARASIPPPANPVFKTRTWVDSRTGQMYRASQYDLMTPHQKQLLWMMEQRAKKSTR